MQPFYFWLGGGHPAVDFVNTLDERLSPSPEERLSSYETLVELTRQSHLIDEHEAEALVQHKGTSSGDSVLAAALLLREALHSTLRALIAHEAPNQTDVALIEAETRRATSARRLAPAEMSLRWLWQKPDAPERPLWELALTSENLLTSEDVRRARMCADDDCGVMFVDYSRAGARRWCSMASCGNRHKARQFRSTHKQSVVGLYFNSGEQTIRLHTTRSRELLGPPLPVQFRIPPAFWNTSMLPRVADFLPLAS